jgi:type IV fimbrial biogenesis protein FimT
MPRGHCNAGVAAHGFTLVEMMVALAVAAILASIAVPSFRSFTANQAVRSASFHLTTDLMFARSEAVKRNATVTLAPSGGDWKSGWSLTAGGQTLRTTAAMHSSVIIEDGAPVSIAFDATGRVVAVGVVRLGLDASVGSATQVRCISLDPSGMPKVSQQACG